MESIFSFLFKYRPVLFAEGDFTFAASWPVATLLLVAAVVSTVALFTYVRPRAKAGRRDRMIMGGLRLAILAVLLFCLFRPTLVLTSVVPQRNFVGVLIDDSRSMTLAGSDDEARGDWIRRALGPESSSLLTQLRERFAVRLFRFSSDTDRVESVAELGFDGTRTDLASALDRAREELSSVPLSGLVVLSDGADNGDRPIAEALVPLQAASVPVFSVGLGEETLSPDVQIGRIEAPRRVLQGTSLIVDVVVTHRGFSGRTVPLTVEDDRRILAEESIELQGDGEPTVTQLRFTLDEPGLHRIRFQVAPQEDERVERNNGRDLLVDVRPDVEKILYFQGQGTFEVGFTRRAVADDENLQLVVLQRSADDKFLRLGVDDGEELAGGFPRTREELFQYEGLVLGSVEASFFTRDQLEMIADFVGQRGGGLLALGGMRAFAEGGFNGTVMEEVLPVVLGEPVADRQAALAQLQVRPTVAGLAHPATQIRPEATDDEATAALWDSLPTLASVNPIGAVKPGATALLTGESASGEERVVLAFHRYGRGKALAFTALDSRTWQMHHEIPLDDPTHENLWQQLLRWVVDGVPGPVIARTDRERAEAGETVRIVADVADSTYLEVNDAVVTATVIGPDGRENRVDLDWTVEEDGRYAGTFVPATDGEYDIEVDALEGEALLGATATQIEVGPSDEEYFDAAQRRALLERVSDETGGRYYTASSSGTLPEDIQYTGGGVTLTEERDLWDMPLLLLLLVGLLGAEWGFRRTRGLV